jgi:hypothetical protein
MVQRAGMFMPNLRTKFHMPSLNNPLVIAFKSNAKEVSAQLRWLSYGLQKYYFKTSGARVAFVTQTGASGMLLNV